ncbi:MAG: VanZ family protein [Clostridia bacterium]
MGTRRILSLLAVLLWTTLIFYNSSHDSDQSLDKTYAVIGVIEEVIQRLTGTPASDRFQAFLWNDFVGILRKTAHVFQFFVLYVLVYFFLGGVQTNRKNLAIHSMLWCVATAVLDEGYQAFIPGRGPSLLDVAIDTAGATCAAGAVFLFERKKRCKT